MFACRTTFSQRARSARICSANWAGVLPAGNTPAQFAEQIRADLARWEKVVRQANIRIE